MRKQTILRVYILFKIGINVFIQLILRIHKHEIISYLMILFIYDVLIVY